eukprot:714381-Rhodomonas_salina.2
MGLMHVFPFPMQVASSSFFSAQTANPVFQCSTFESAHLWAYVLVAVTCGVAFTVAVLCQQTQ